MTVIYGRRRIGKSTLIAEFIKNKKAVSYTASKVGSVRNLELFSDRISKPAKALLNLYKTQRGVFLFKSAVFCFKAKIRKVLKKFKVVRVLNIKKKYKFDNRYI